MMKNSSYLLQSQMSGRGCQFTINLSIDEITNNDARTLIANLIENYLEDNYGKDPNKWTEQVVHIWSYYSNEYSKRHLYKLKIFNEWYYITVSFLKDSDEADITMIKNGIISTKKLHFR